MKFARVQETPNAHVLKTNRTSRHCPGQRFRTDNCHCNGPAKLRGGYLLLLGSRRLRAGQALRDRLLHHLACPQLCGRHRAEVRATGAARRSSNRACLTALDTRPRGTVVSVATRASSSVKVIVESSRMRYPEPADSGFAQGSHARLRLCDRLRPLPEASARARPPQRGRVPYCGGEPRKEKKRGRTPPLGAARHASPVSAKTFVNVTLPVSAPPAPRR